MRAIQKELGEKDEFKNEIQELEEKIKAEEDVGGGPREGREGAEEAQDDVADVGRGDRRPQLHRLAHLAARGSEYTEDKLDIDDAEKVLEEDHYGLEKVKERILEYLAVQSLVGQLKGPILCLVGPPGRRQDVARQVDRARHRPQVRARLARRRARRGRDPRPPPHLHRRAARQDHPVDEEGRLGQPGLPARRGRQDVDRLPRRSVVGAARGARSRAEQRPSTTTTSTSTTTSRRSCSSPRRTPSSASRGRSRIAWRSSASRATPSSRSSTSPSATWSEAARGERLAGGEHRRSPTTRCSALIRHYTKEAGRPEPRARDRLGLPQGRRRGGEEGPQRARPRHGEDAGAKYLGPPRFRYGKAEAGAEDRRRDRPRLDRARRRAAGHRGARSLPGKGKLIITGRLGEVMQESAQAALSYVRSRADELGLERDFYQKIDIHIHVPGGRDPEGRPVGRHHHGDGAGLGADAHPGAPRPRHDRRGHAAGLRAADRRTEGEGARRAPRRHQARPDPGREREGHPGDSGGRS